RNVALVTLVFLGLHIVTAVVDPFTNLGWASAIVPFSSYYRTFSLGLGARSSVERAFWLGLGTIAAELLVAIVVTSLLRGLIGHAAWRVVHWLTYASWAVGGVHGPAPGAAP